MCDCIKKIEEKSFETVKNQKEGEFEKGNLIPSSFMIVKNKFTNRQTHSEYQFTFAPRKKNGTIGMPKKQTVNIIHQYCPFCGEKHQTD